MRDARYVRLISWTLRCRSKQLLRVAEIHLLLLKLNGYRAECRCISSYEKTELLQSSRVLMYLSLLKSVQIAQEQQSLDVSLVTEECIVQEQQSVDVSLVTEECIV